MSYKNKYLKYKKKYNILKNIIGGSELGKIIYFKDSDNHILLEKSLETNETLGDIKQEISDKYKIDTNNILFTNLEHNIRYKDSLPISNINDDNVLVYFLKELNFTVKLNGDTYQDNLNITTYSNQKLKGIFEIPIVKQYFENQNIEDLNIYDDNNQNINDLTPIQLGDYRKLYIKDKSTFNQHSLINEEEKSAKKKQEKLAKKKEKKIKQMKSELEKEELEKYIQELEFNKKNIGDKIQNVEEVIKKYDELISDEKNPAENYKLISKQYDYKNVLKDLQDRYISNMKNLMNFTQIKLKYI